MYEWPTDGTLVLGRMPATAVGAVLLAAVELLCRWAGPLFNLSVIPMGVLTALAGGPLFLWLLRRHHLRAFAP